MYFWGPEITAANRPVDMVLSLYYLSLQCFDICVLGSREWFVGRYGFHQ